ncbi:MAG: hypothetical protein IIT98_02040 [Kiritimatiellae bacterium]|nr:hypothetical protein [Kiritimatiellia bacterium]
MRKQKGKRAQAMIETLFAMMLIVFVFMEALRLSRMIQTKTVLDHAAGRAARAKAVGFNRFMCEKSARAAMIPVSGKRLWPQYGEYDTVSRVAQYMAAENAGRANAVLEYAGWHNAGISIDSHPGLAPVANSRIDVEDRFFGFRASGSATIESHFPFYMDEAGR